MIVNSSGREKEFEQIVGSTSRTRLQQRDDDSDDLPAVIAIGKVQDVTRGPSALVAAILGAGATGIIGNAAYDLLKLAVRKLSRRRLRKLVRRTATDELELLARLAIRDRCGPANFPVPTVDERCIKQLHTDGPAYTYYFEFRDFTAKVRIPKGDLTGRQLEVTLYTNTELIQSYVAGREAARRLNGSTPENK